MKDFESIGSIRKCQICKEFKSLAKFKTIDWSRTTLSDSIDKNRDKIFYHVSKGNNICAECELNLWKEIYEDEAAQHAADKVVLDMLFETLNEEQIEFIKYEIEESAGGVEFEIISEKPNLKPDRTIEEGYLMNVYVDQYSSYPCEDCYHGYAYVEIIPNEKYLKWSFSM